MINVSELSMPPVSPIRHYLAPTINARKFIISVEVGQTDI